jgi:lysophospholipase L1-like esterase
MKQTNISRRRFLTIAGATGLAAGLPSASIFAAEKYPNVPEKDRKLVFLFQGDSITDGSWGAVCPRDPEHRFDGNTIGPGRDGRKFGNGYVYAVATRIIADFPQAGFTFHNRGIAGHKASDLEKRWDSDTLALKPDVLSILVGINDVGAVFYKYADAYDTSVFEQTYRRLLQQCRDANPNILFVLGLPFMFPVGEHKKEWDFWSREVPLRADVVRKLAKEFDAVLVDYPQMFAEACKRAPIEHWTWDGCHPSIPTHELMAREWIKQVSVRLKFLKKYKY